MASAGPLPSLADMTPEKRLGKPCEDDIYMNKFPAQWKPHFEDLKLMKPLSKKGKPLPPIAVRKRATRLCWKEEKDLEVIAVVDTEYKIRLKAYTEQEEALEKLKILTKKPRTPKEYEVAINGMGLCLKAWSEELVAMTGGYVEILWGSPIPSMMGGLRTYRVCAGPQVEKDKTYLEWRNEQASEEGSNMVDYDTGVKKPFLSWLWQIFSGDIRKACALVVEDGDDGAAKVPDSVDNEEGEMLQLNTTKDVLIVNKGAPSETMTGNKRVLTENATANE
ncbi:hypothetical protein M422DRAFT_239713 [Sphaerobolus stellatus SS14]|nr:hypothetical protein M422DRAFT_239713 [Sphaerobolus stellatus SS14]